MRLGRRRIGGVEAAVGDDAGREPGNGGPGTDPNAAVDVTRAGVGDRGGAEHGEILGRPERLRPSRSRDERKRDGGEDKTRDESKVK